MGRKKQKIRWTSVDQEGFFTNDNEDLEQAGNKEAINTNLDSSNSQNRTYRRVPKKSKYVLSETKDCKSPEDNSVTGCESKDCESCTCDMYCCCTTHEHSSICDALSNKYKNSSKTSKMDQTKPESNNEGNSTSDLNESNANTKDCDTNSEHSSMMNGSTHSSYNNSNRSLNIHRMESFSSSGTGSKEYERHSNHGERRYERKYNYSRDGSRRSYGGSDRGGGNTWINAPLAPRFERKAAIHAANAAANGNGYHSHHYGEQNGSNGCYDDSMSMDMEDLPNGFTKIRSKNLDVLFKKDYYAQRVHLNSGSSGTGTAATVNSCSVSPNPQVATSQPTVSEAPQKGENNDCAEGNKEETIDSIKFNLTKPSKSNDAINSAEIGNSGSENVNDGGENKSSISSTEPDIDNSTQPTLSAQISKFDTNPAIGQMQTSLRPTESDESKDIAPTENDDSEIGQPKEHENAQNNNSNINSHASPFYPKSQITSSTEQEEANSVKTCVAASIENDSPPVPTCNTSSMPIQQSCFDSTSTTMAGAGNNKRPNLFLYAPSSNTIIPCEEIIIPNHPNVMQEPMNMSVCQKPASESSISNELPLESNSRDNNNEDGKKENKQNDSFSQSNLTDIATTKTEITTSRIPLMSTASTNVDNTEKDVPNTSSTTPGMNGNAPAFIPRAQQQYYPASLNIHQVPQQPHAMIHYDQFGAPYTSFHGNTVPLPTQTTLSTGHVAPPAPGMPNIQHPIFNREYITGNLQYHQQSSVLSNITVASSTDMLSGTSPTTPNGHLNSSSETSSAESSATMHSPADLSVYSPANWVSSPSQTPQAPNVGDASRNGNLIIHQQVPMARVEGPEVASNGSRATQQSHAEYHRSISSPASYGNQQTQIPSVNGTIPYGPDGPIAYTQRAQYPPHYNSHVYYQPSAAAAQYINHQGGSNVWYNLQQQYYSMNGNQAFIGPQYQGYTNGYGSGGGTNLQFMCESSTMPSSAGDSMAEDDPRDRSEEEIDIQNQSRTHIQNHLQSQGQLMKNEFKPHLSSEREKYKLQKQPYPRHSINNNATVMVSTNPGTASFTYKKDKETREGSHGKEDVTRPFIPGLPAERLTNKRVHKKRRKKKNTSTDVLPGEQSSLVAPSSIILPEGHSSVPSLTAQQHPKGKTLNNIHRGSSSSEDLFNESTIMRADNMIQLTSANSVKNERECQFDSANRRISTKFSNPKGLKNTNGIEGCEGTENNSTINIELSNEKSISNINKSCLDKSSGCDNEKAAYQVCETLTETSAEIAMPSLPTTSPSSPLQSINPSSSSMLISSSCVSSQDEEDINKETEHNTKQRALRTDIRRGGGYEIPKRNRNRDRSSSISSNEETGNSCKGNVSERTNNIPLHSKIQNIESAPISNKSDLQTSEKVEEKSNDQKFDETEGTVQKRSSESETKSKYSDTVKKYNSAAMREAALLKIEDNLKHRVGPHERNQKHEHKSAETQMSKQGRNYTYENGSQSKYKNRRNFSSSNVAPASEKTMKNSNNHRSNQASHSPYKLQRSSSTQNSLANGLAEDASNDGKKLYSKVACKATDINVNSVHNVPNKSQGQNKRGNINTKQNFTLLRDEIKLDKKLADMPLERHIKENEHTDAKGRRRNSADDAGWEMATGAYGGSKTKRNRKGARATNTNINSAEPSRDSSVSNKSMKGQAECLEQSPNNFLSEEHYEPVDEQKLSDEKHSVKSENSKQNENSSDENTTPKILPETNSSPDNIENQPIEKQSNATDEKSAASTPNSKSSTLRKQRKKRLTQDASNNGISQGEKTVPAPTIRPVLIQDGLIDIFGKSSSTVVGKQFAGKTTNAKSAVNILDQAKIDDVVQKGHMDSLFVSEIGYGMIGGPISMGRFGTSKYIPPDRSEEIRPMQDLLKEKQKADEAADAATKNTVIKVLMGEVQVSTASEIEEESIKDGEMDIKTSEKFEDVTDKICENIAESEKISRMKITANVSSQPTDLDLD